MNLKKVGNYLLIGCLFFSTPVGMVVAETGQNENFTEEVREEMGGDLKSIREGVNEILSNQQCLYFTKYHNLGDKGEEVLKIQIFLASQGLLSGVYTGYYGIETKNAVEKFQTKYADEILTPWDITSPTGYWYKTTRNKANEILGCNEGEVILDNGEKIN